MDKQVKIRVSVEADKATVDNQITSWKDLNKSIKDTRSELVRLQSEGKQGSKEWDAYANKLRELTKQKQIVQRQTKLTSQQLLTMSKDLTVVAFGIKDVVTSIQNLGKEKQSVGDLAMSFGTLGVQVLAIFPAIQALNKSLQATGFISAGLISTLGTLLGGLTAITGEVYLMYNAFSKLDVIIQAWKDVLSGENLFDTWAKTTKEMTGGLIDFTDEVEKNQQTQEHFFDRGTDYLKPWSERDVINFGKNKVITHTEPNRTKSPTLTVENQKDLNILEKYREEVTELVRQKVEIVKLVESETTKVGELIFLWERLTQIDSELLEKQKSITNENAKRVDLAKEEFELRQRFEGDTRPSVPTRNVKTIDRLITDFSGLNNDDEREAFISSLYDTILTDTQSITSEIGSILNLLNVETGSFVGQMLGGFNDALGLITSIVNIIKTANEIGSIFDFLKIAFFAEGGHVRGAGTGTSDSIPARLSNGEFVVNAESTKRYYPLLELINGNGRNRSLNFATGGFVSGKSISPNISVIVSTEFDQLKSYEVVYEGQKISRMRGTNRL